MNIPLKFIRNLLKQSGVFKLYGRAGKNDDMRLWTNDNLLTRRLSAGSEGGENVLFRNENKPWKDL